MKNFFTLALLLISSALFAQKIDGFYTGVLNNDSANRMVQQYELAIAMYKGKITGYSYVTFIVKDTFYYGIRKVKGEIIGDSIVVTDDKFVSNNFPESPAKGVKRTITIPLNGQDSITMLSGKWKTNQTKKYYSVPGTIELVKSKDSTNSPLINHLKELGIVSTENYMVTAKQMPPADNTTVSVNKKDQKTSDPSKQNTRSNTDPISANKALANTNKVKPNPAEGSGTGAATNSEVSKQGNKVKEKEAQTANGSGAKPTNGIVQASTSQTVATQNNTTKTAAIQTSEKTVTTGALVMPDKPVYQQRATVVTKTVDVSSDSLVLAFYDNGVVDGDSISVYLNDENIVSSIKLKTVATKKTIYFSGRSEIKLVLVAENLGTIPPNTGLMSIRDGDNIYQVHFSADMQTNASIIIRRKIN